MGGEEATKLTEYPERQTVETVNLLADYTSSSSSLYEFMPLSILNIIAQVTDGPIINCNNNTFQNNSRGTSCIVLEFSTQKNTTTTMANGTFCSEYHGHSSRWGQAKSFPQYDQWTPNTCESPQAYLETTQMKHSSNFTETKLYSGTFQCTFCSYSAKTASLLQKHVRIHTGEKPFHCVLCPYKAAQKENLKAHMMRIHQKPSVSGSPAQQHNVSQSTGKSYMIQSGSNRQLQCIQQHSPHPMHSSYQEIETPEHPSQQQE
ncbi:unnamed protein product [Meganyctiphanes norvegica]|uniref:C2H2-type domain-containing protein n=1 Tax=Meganyctiphanes norvegica TaxID=48144 RepID=A0AAV2RBK9_MEGNR